MLDCVNLTHILLITENNGDISPEKLLRVFQEESTVLHESVA